MRNPPRLGNSVVPGIFATSPFTHSPLIWNRAQIAPESGWDSQARGVPDHVAVSPDTALTPSTEVTVRMPSGWLLQTLNWYSLPGLPTT